MPPVLPASALVIAGFIPDDADRLRRALSLPDAAFPAREDNFLFRLYREYFRVHRGVMPVQFIAKRLEGEPAETAQAIANRFTTLRDTVVEDHVFEWAFTTTFETWRDEEARGALAKAVRIIAGPGDVEEGEAVRGYHAMRESLARSFQRIDRQMTGSTPERTLADASDALLSAVGSNEAEARTAFPTGIDVLDSAMAYGGPASGQLWFVAAYAGQGKTTFCTSVLTHAAVMHGLNVVYLTGETLLEEVELKLVARHVREPQFNCPHGLDLMALRSGSLPPDQLEAFHGAVHDLTSRTGLDYGHAVFRQMPMRNNVDDVLETLERFEAQWPVHVLIVDSIDMVRISAEMARGAVSYREQLSAAIEDFANLAVSYANGRGLIVISPYQIKRDGYERALERSGRYELSDLSETAMAERRASVVLSLLRLPDSPGQLRAQVLKNRSGATPDFPLDVDYRTAHIGASAGVVASASDLVF